MLVAAPGAAAPTVLIDAALDCATPTVAARRRHPRAVHHGTREAPGPAAALGDGLFQLRLEQPLLPRAATALVIRSLAPPDTLGGGVLLDAAPPRHGPSRDLLARLERRARGGRRSPRRRPGPQELASPPAPTRPRSAPAALEVEADASEPPATSRRSTLTSAPIPTTSRRCAPTAASRGWGVACTSTRKRSPTCRPRVIAVIERDGSITIATLRDELQTSRRYAQALLEALDAERVTLRVGDERVLRRKSS